MPETTVNYFKGVIEKLWTTSNGIHNTHLTSKTELHKWIHQEIYWLNAEKSKKGCLSSDDNGL